MKEAAEGFSEMTGKKNRKRESEWLIGRATEKKVKERERTSERQGEGQGEKER